MAEAGKGGCGSGRRESSASTRPAACGDRHRLGGKRGDAGDDAGDGLGDGEEAHFAGAFQVPDRPPRFSRRRMPVIDHAAVDRLGHVVDGEAGDRDGGERLHLDAGLAGDLGGGADAEAGQVVVGSISTATLVRPSGWQSGISSWVRLAAMMPAMRAVPMTSPFLASPARIASSVSGAMITAPSATARRVGDRLAPRRRPCWRRRPCRDG